jgi:hypothetical protein
MLKKLKKGFCFFGQNGLFGDIVLASWTSDIWRRSFLMQDLLPESRRQTSFLNVVVPLTLHLPDPLRLSATAKCSWVLRNV